ncbi:MAG: tyrosine recombinase [Kiritimatiellae bacterium]|nr:tyrosine recombinase [Kiritimatiellia bacterium]
MGDSRFTEIDRFLDSLQFERGESENTRLAYASDLSFFSDYLLSRGISSLERVTRQDVLDFLESERKQELKVSTRYRRLVAVKMFFRYLVSTGRLKNDVTDVIRSLRKDHPLPKVLSEEDIRTLLESISGQRPYDLRDRALLEMLYACGLRVSEIADVQLDDFDLEAGLLRCCGKGDKQRVVPIGMEAIQRVELYLTNARPVFAKGNLAERHLFLTRLAKPFGRTGIFIMLEKRARAAGLLQRISPHVLRHCFASHLLAHGAQIRAIQEMLGHANIATTQIYTHVNSNELLSTHAKFFPRS